MIVPVAGSSSRAISLIQDPEARRHDAGGIAGMNAFLQHAHGEAADGGAAQRGGEPHAIVIAAARIEAHDKRRLADAGRQMIDIEGQVEAAGFLASLDQDHAARMRHALVAQCKERRERAEHRIAVIRAAAPEQLVAVASRGVHGPIAVHPAHHLRLLVEMAVEQHGLRTLTRDFDEDQRRAVRQLHDFERWRRRWPRSCRAPRLRTASPHRAYSHAPPNPDRRPAICSGCGYIP